MKLALYWEVYKIVRLSVQFYPKLKGLKYDFFFFFNMCCNVRYNRDFMFGIERSGSAGALVGVTIWPVTQIIFKGFVRISVE